MEKNENKVKVSEKISHGFRKRWLVNGIQLTLIIAVLVVAHYCLYLWLDSHDVPEFDITTNKIHTLSDTSKEVIRNINKEVSILVYGYPETSSIFDLLKQYTDTNNLITYRRLTDEEDLTIINEHGLSSGYYAVIMKTNDSEKVIDGSEFSVTDYTLGQTVDVTEQTLTNSLLAVVEENKPKIYFTAGHDEVNVQYLYTITYLLNNEAFEFTTLNMELTGEIPEDCDILAIISPEKDFSESDVALVKEYINKGGAIFFSMGLRSDEDAVPNLQTILEEYGVEIENGFILEYDTNAAPDTKYPFVFTPKVSPYNRITADIYTDSYLLLVESARLKFKDDTTLDTLKVEKDVLAYSSDESTFIDNLEADSVANAALTASTGRSDIAASIEKKVGTGDDEKTSKLVIIANTAFMVDQYYEAVSDSARLSYFGSNKDFVINSMSYLGNKDNYLTIRKDYATNTYKPTTTQNNIVLTIIFSVPLFILASGIIIWNYRKKRK